MTSLFVTSSGTDIGKTHVCCQLISFWQPKIKLRCSKPVVTGFDPNVPNSTDTGRLLNAQNLGINPTQIEKTSPWRFRSALSADMAAAREGRLVPFDELVAFCRAPADVDLNLIEGIGGVMAPLDQDHTILDLISALETSVLLVVGSYLGTLSHTLTAVEVLTQRGRPPLAIVLSESPSSPVPAGETASTLDRFCRDIPIAILPRVDADATAAAALATSIAPLLKLA
jgi:dethiobiotin synthetase